MKTFVFISFSFTLELWLSALKLWIKTFRRVKPCTSTERKEIIFTRKNKDVRMFSSQTWPLVKERKKGKESQKNKNKQWCSTTMSRGESCRQCVRISRVPRALRDACSSTESKYLMCRQGVIVWAWSLLSQMFLLNCWHPLTYPAQGLYAQHVCLCLLRVLLARMTKLKWCYLNLPLIKSAIWWMTFILNMTALLLVPKIKLLIK